MTRMNRDGSTATTEAPRRAASTVAGPIPAPTSRARSPGTGAARSTTARLMGDCQNLGNRTSQRSLRRMPLS